jgi:hypothetical protein
MTSYRLGLRASAMDFADCLGDSVIGDGTSRQKVFEHQSRIDLTSAARQLAVDSGDMLPPKHVAASE